MTNKSKLSRFGYRYLKAFKVATIILISVFSLQLLPAVAQSNQLAPVDIDGRPIFRVSGTQDTPAQERAKYINTILKTVVESEKIPEITVEKGDNTAQIKIGDTAQIQVTTNDLRRGENHNQKADKWKNRIIATIKQAREERSTDFVRNTLFLSLLLIILTVALHSVLGRLSELLHRYILSLITPEDSSDQNQQQNSLNILLKSTLFIARTALWIGVALYITNLFPLTRQWSFDITRNILFSLTSPIFKEFTIVNIFILIGFFLGLMILSGAVTNILRSRILRLLRISLGAQEIIAIIFKYTLIGVGSIVLLQSFGVDLSSLAILASALGVGIGFGFQDIAKNFGSGLVLLFERPIQVGDFIEIGKYMGTVERIGARSVVIRTLDRVSIIVPNSRFLEDEVINWSHHNPISRIHIPIEVSYNADVKVVKKALLEAAKTHSEVLSIPQPQVLFTGFGDSSLDFELLIWIDAPSHQVPIKSDLCFQIEATLKKYNIEIPFPQRDLHLRSGDLPLKLSSELEQALLQKQQQNGKNQA